MKRGGGRPADDEPVGREAYPEVAAERRAEKERGKRAEENHLSELA